MLWSETDCCIAHPKHGKLGVDVSSGCPEIKEEKAHELIKEHEALSVREKVRTARVNRLVSDFPELSNHGVIKMLQQESVDGEAALRVFVSQRFPTVPSEMLDELVVILGESPGEDETWNRRIRKGLHKSDGAFMHLFCGASQKVFADLCGRWNVAHLAGNREGICSELPHTVTSSLLLSEAKHAGLQVGLRAEPPLCAVIVMLSVLRIMGLGLSGKGVIAF